MSLDSTEESYRACCFRCFRPTSECYCAAIPSIKNKTEILILQHRRERDHPFNTARMVKLALERSKLFHGTSASLSKIKIPLRPAAGLLFPSRHARTLSELPPDQKPDQLVLIDGTWSQARTMIRDLPQLQDLPHYKLEPTRPGQYRIRLEPTDTSLSTVEAAVEALREIEPETSGLDQLIVAFEQMVQKQLDHPRVGREHYSGGPRSGRTMNIPGRLFDNPNSIVVAYGEAAFRESTGLPKTRNSRRPPLYWIAQRLGTGEMFCRALIPDVSLTDSFLKHLELLPQHFRGAVSHAQFVGDWQSFIRTTDTIAVYSQGAIRLLENVGAPSQGCVDLKSINFDHLQRRRSLAQFIDDNELVREPVDPNHGRAGKRLANAIALVNHLRRSRSRD